MSATTADPMHNPMITRLLAQSRLDDFRRAARSSAYAPGPRLKPRPSQPSSPVTLRFAFPDDALTVARLATLDSSPVPAAPLLLAEVAGELRAALSLSDGTVIADPFYPSGPVVELLRARASQLHGVSRPSSRRRLFPRARTRLATWR
jgi:hypothetical protein